MQTPTTTDGKGEAVAEKASGPEGRAAEFRAVEGGSQTRSGELLLVEAYAVLWLILMGWLFSLWRKQAALNARLTDLENVLEKAASGPAK
jgi:hypothetical protein